MNDISSKFIEELGVGASDGIKACRKFLSYEGSDVRMHQRAKNGSELVCSYVKLLGIENARVALQASIESGTPHKSLHTV